MIHSLRRLVSPIAAMVLILGLGAATPARADLEIMLNGTEVASAASGGTAVYGYPATTVAGFLVNILSTSSNSAGTSTFATLSGADLQITNNNAGTATLLISLGDVNFTGPQYPPSITMTSSIGGTVSVADPANTLTYQSFVNNDNSQNGTTATGTQMLSATPGITGGSYNSTQTSTISSLLGTGSPTKMYSITETFALTLSAGSTFNFSSTTTLQSNPTIAVVVPEPSTMALAGLGALGLIGYGLRRRKALGA